MVFPRPLSRLVGCGQECVCGKPEAITFFFNQVFKSFKRGRRMLLVSRYITFDEAERLKPSRALGIPVHFH